MVPRGEIVYIDENITKEKLIKIINKEAHSRMPVVRGDLDNCLGMVHIKDLFKKINLVIICFCLWRCKLTKIMIGNYLLQKMKKQNTHLAIVIDEYSSVTGLITIEDLVEEIVGEIEDEHDSEEEPLFHVENKKLIMDAAMLIDDFEREFNTQIPENLKEDVGTIGGIIFNLAGRVPKKDEKFKINKKLSFTVHYLSKNFRSCCSRRES